MAVTVSAAYQGFFQIQRGNRIRRAVLTVSGLTAGTANTIPHGLPGTPQQIDMLPGSNGTFPGGWGLSAGPDGTNIYVVVANNGATSGTFNAQY